jgi:hypothetical protein
MTTRIKNVALATLIITGLIQFYFAYNAYAQTTAPENAISPSISRNWAGYVADSAGNYTGVSGSWVVATPSLSSNGSDAAWVGIGGISSHDLIQTGTQAIVEGGKIHYSAWYEALPGLEHTISMDVSGGDSISASITETSPGIWQIHIKNNTNGETYDKEVSYDSSHSSAEWIEELPTGVGFSLALDQFGSVPFTSGTARINGATVSIAGAGAHALEMANRKNETTATVSGLGTDGSSFTVTRNNVQSDPVTERTRAAYQRTGSGYYSRYSQRSYSIYIVEDANGIHFYLAR